MKLHLSKSLRAALVVAIAPVMAEQVIIDSDYAGVTDNKIAYSAAMGTDIKVVGVTVTNVWDSTSSGPTAVTLVGGSVTYVNTSLGESTTLTLGDEVNKNTDNSFTATNSTLRAAVTGNGNLTLVNSDSSKEFSVTSTFTHAGNLTVGTGVGLKGAAAQINNTGSVTLASGNDVKSTSIGSNVTSIIVNDGTRLDASGTIGAAVTLSGAGGDHIGAMSMASGATINGGVTITSAGAEIDIYSGTGTLAGGVTLGGDLTINEEAKANWYSQGTVKIGGAVTGTGDITLSAGKLELASNATVANTVGISIDGGTLDLSNVATLTLESLDLAAGTTIVLGENTRIEVTDALTIGSGVIFDVSSWCDYDSFSPYELITYTGTGTFAPELPQYVTIKTSTADNEKAFLTVSGNSVTLVPEPTTATLSLLALAGLAARRRRK